MPVTVKAKKTSGAPTRRAKGEQTRRKILRAVFDVISRDGIRGVTHRAVAAEAGVQLSLTTYYFKDIDAMIREAFEQFTEHMRPEMEAMWEELFAYLDGFSRAELRRLPVREEVCEQLSQKGTDYIVDQIMRKPVGLAVEQIFFTQARMSPDLRAMGAAHRARLLQPIVDLCRRFNNDDPEIDAELLLDTITTLEYQSLALPPGEVDRDLIYRLLRRHIGWIVGLKRA